MNNETLYHLQACYFGGYLILSSLSFPTYKMKIIHYLAGLPRSKVMPRTVPSSVLWMREWKEKRRAEKRKKKRILLERKNPYFTQYPKISHNKALLCQQQVGPAGNLSHYQVNVEDKGKSRKCEWWCYDWKERKSRPYLLSSYFVQFIYNTSECLLWSKHYAKFWGK